MLFQSVCHRCFPNVFLQSSHGNHDLHMLHVSGIMWWYSSPWSEVFLWDNLSIFVIASIEYEWYHLPGIRCYYGHSYSIFITIISLYIYIIISWFLQNGMSTYIYIYSFITIYIFWNVNIPPHLQTTYRAMAQVLASREPLPRTLLLPPPALDAMLGLESGDWASCHQWIIMSYLWINYGLIMD